MLSRAFFAYLHLDKLLEVVVSIHGRKNRLRAKLSRDFLISEIFAIDCVLSVFTICSLFIFRILLDFRGLKKVCTVNSDETDKVSLVEQVFQTHLQTSSDSLAHAIVPLQRYDPEWEDLVDRHGSNQTLR